MNLILKIFYRRNFGLLTFDGLASSVMSISCSDGSNRAGSNSIAARFTGSIFSSDSVISVSSSENGTMSGSSASSSCSSPSAMITSSGMFVHESRQLAHIIVHGRPLFLQVPTSCLTSFLAFAGNHF